MTDNRVKGSSPRVKGLLSGLVAGLVVALAAAVWFIGKGRVSVLEIGRYQISADGSGRMDTVTGKAWRLDGGGWKVIAPDPLH